MKFPEFKLISFVCYCASLVLGLLIGYLDFFTTEVQGAVLLLLVATAILGYTNPEGAWRWGDDYRLRDSCYSFAGIVPRRSPGVSGEQPVECSFIAANSSFSWCLFRRRFALGVE